MLNLLLAAAFVQALCGTGFWWLEQHAKTLPDGLWLPFTTAAAMGYGDIVPSTPASKIFSVVVVMLGFGVLSLVNAAITTRCIETEERIIEREILRDVHCQMDALRGELAAVWQTMQDPTSALSMMRQALLLGDAAHPPAPPQVDQTSSAGLGPQSAKR